ncbi:helix-turn-helix transcriptional regulator [Acidovorax sp. sif1233]|uniref:helix-turn-helix transcriptional regulator n=1 Tax=unclassified Acidovorax TaxID=2684926 RepID=UPI001C43F464|nr:AraC family transcriptional regulator [Acidovorax sp. sif1233]MBV7455511.1 helix-turn-helix transcriptional regulator [Acidovorax sp. sif1233]
MQTPTPSLEGVEEEQPEPAGATVPIQRLRLSGLPGDRDLLAMRDYLADIVRADFAPLHAHQPWCYEGATRTVPGATWSTQRFDPVVSTRTAAMCRDGQDDLMLFVSSACMTIEQPGHETLRILPGGAALASRARPMRVVQEQAGTLWALRVPHRDLAWRLPRLSAAPLLALHQGTPLLHMLPRMGRLLDSDPLHGAAAQQLAARQLQDMLAVALGQSREFTEWAEDHSLPTARLRAVQADIAAHLGSGRLSMDWLSERQGISARHLRRLLAQAGTSYQDAVRTARLQAARAMLADPRNAGLSISAIAHACGFSEASALNRAFKQHYGMTPGQARCDAGLG